MRPDCDKPCSIEPHVSSVHRKYENDLGWHPQLVSVPRQAKDGIQTNATHPQSAKMWALNSFTCTFIGRQHGIHATQDWAILSKWIPAAAGFCPHPWENGLRRAWGKTSTSPNKVSRLTKLGPTRGGVRSRLLDKPSVYGNNLRSNR